MVTLNEGDDDEFTSEVTDDWAIYKNDMVAMDAIGGTRVKMSDDEKIALFKRFYTKHKRVPKTREQFDGKNIGSMLSQFRSAFSKQTMSVQLRKALNSAMPGWSAN